MGFGISTEDADGVEFWWDGDGWTKDHRRAKFFKHEGEAAHRLDHIQSVSFGARIDNACVSYVE